MSFVCMIFFVDIVYVYRGARLFWYFNSDLYDSLILKAFTQQYHDDELAQEYQKKNVMLLPIRSELP